MRAKTELLTRRRLVGRALLLGILLAALGA
jgi:hypothetical protein